MNDAIPPERRRMRFRIVETGPSRYPALGDCPCGKGAIRTVSDRGTLLFFECGLKTVGVTPCFRRFYHSGGDDGVILCSVEGDPTQYDFGRMIEEGGARSFESHLPP